VGRSNIVGDRPGTIESPGGRVSVVIAGGIATLWAAAAVIAPLLTISLIAWICDSRSTAPATDAMRMALDIWLLSHAVPVNLTAGAFSLVPLTVAGFVVWQLIRAGLAAARAVRADSISLLTKVSVTIAVWYAAIGAGAAWCGHLSGASVTPWLAAAALGGIALVFSGIGAVCGTEFGRSLLRHVSTLLRDVCRATCVALALLMAAAMLLTIAMLVASGGRILDLMHNFSLGAVGVIGLLLISLAYLPSLMLWTAAYVVGVGFFVGGGQLVSPLQVDASSAPVFPLLAAVPTTPANAVVKLLLAIPVAAGLVAGIWLSHRHRTSPTRLVLFGAAGVGLLSGLALGALGWLAGGSLGVGALATFGPRALYVGAFAAVGIGAGSVLGATMDRWVVPFLLRLVPGPPADTATGPTPVRRRNRKSDPSAGLPSRTVAALTSPPVTEDLPELPSDEQSEPVSPDDEKPDEAERGTGTLAIRTRPDGGQVIDFVYVARNRGSKKPD
jgi:hypothetical protein